MFDSKIKKEKLIMLVINTSKNIKCLYDNMNIQNKDSLEKELRSEITKENILLNALNIHESNVKEIYKDFINILNETYIDNFNFTPKDESLKKLFNQYIKITNSEKIYTNDLILKRFESYLIMKFKSNPTESLEKKESIRKKENEAIISHAALIDYHTNVVKNLDELEQSTTSPLIANKALQEKNRLLYTDKFIEDKYLNNNYFPYQYDKCIYNGFNQDYVDVVYTNTITDITNEQARHCYLYSNKTLENRNDAAKFAVSLQILKSSLSLLDTETLSSNLDNFKNLSISSGKKSAKMIYDTMSETIKEKENENSIKVKKLTS